MKMSDLQYVPEGITFVDDGDPRYGQIIARSLGWVNVSSPGHSAAESSILTSSEGIYKTTIEIDGETYDRAVLEFLVGPPAYRKEAYQPMSYIHVCFDQRRGTKDDPIIQLVLLYDGMAINLEGFYTAMMRILPFFQKIRERLVNIYLTTALGFGAFRAEDAVSEH